MSVLLVDADYLVYSAGFAVEKTAYAVSCVTPNGLEPEDVVDSLAAAKAWQEARAWPMGTRHRKPVRMASAEPLSHAVHIMNNMLKKIQNRATVHFGTRTYHRFLYITGPGNFRNEVATIRKYKGNRDALHKPIHYQALRDHLKKLGAMEVVGIEADDAVATVAAAMRYEDCIIAAVDKDLWTVPGVHYNFMKDEWDEVSPARARLNFYTQLLIGDPVDNILGCYRCGKRRASQLLDESQTEWEMYELCLEEYRGSVLLKGCPYEDPYDALLENGQLLHLCRHRHDVWAPPRLPADHSLSATSSAILRSGESASNTNPTPSTSSCQSLTSEASSSAKPAGRKSRASRATRPTSSSPGPSTTSRRKGGSSRKSSAASPPSTSST